MDDSHAERAVCVPWKGLAFADGRIGELAGGTYDPRGERRMQETESLLRRLGQEPDKRLCKLDDLFNAQWNKLMKPGRG